MGIADDVREFVDSNWDLDRPLRDWWARMADAGLAYPQWPVGLGGRGLGAADARRGLEAFGTAGVVGPPSGIATIMGVPTVLAYGDEEQQRRFVPPAASGADVWCQLFSEPGAGSDLAGLTARAVRDGDEYVVNGQKVWNSAADVADWGMLLVRTDVNVPKHEGLTFMLIDMHQPGVEVRPLVQMNGGAEFCEVFLTDARVPVRNVIGAVGGGWRIAKTTMGFERGTVGQRFPTGMVQARAGALGGQLDRPLREVVESARRAEADPTRRFDVRVGPKAMIALAKEFGADRDPVVRQRVADYWIRNEVLRLTVQRTRDNSRGGRPGPEGSVIKLATALLAHQSRDTSLSIVGAEGMLYGDSARDHGKVQRAAVSSHAPSLGGGTNEIQRNIIGEQALGLPREPSDDSTVPFKDLRHN